MLESGKIFNIEVSNNLTLEGKILDISDNFVAEVYEKSTIKALHVGKAEITMQGKNGLVTHYIVVNPSYNIIPEPLLMYEPLPALPIPTNYLFSKWGEVYFAQSNGWHRHSYFATYQKGEIFYDYISEPNNRYEIDYINIEVPQTSENLVYCSKYLKERFEKVASTLKSEWYAHKKQSAIDYMVEFTTVSHGLGPLTKNVNTKISTRSASDYYRIEYSIPAK